MQESETKHWQTESRNRKNMPHDQFGFMLKWPLTQIRSLPPCIMLLGLRFQDPLHSYSGYKNEFPNASLRPRVRVWVREGVSVWHQKMTVLASQSRTCSAQVGEFEKRTVPILITDGTHSAFLGAGQAWQSYCNGTSNFYCKDFPNISWDVLIFSKYLLFSQTSIIIECPVELFPRLFFKMYTTLKFYQFKLLHLFFIFLALWATRHVWS